MDDNSVLVCRNKMTGELVTHPFREHDGPPMVANYLEPVLSVTRTPNGLQVIDLRQGGAVLSDSSVTTFQRAFSAIALEMLGVMVEKRELRGTENITRQGIYGVATRMAEDKLARIQRAVEALKLMELLKARGINPWTVDDGLKLELAGVTGDEAEDTLADDLIDTANYAIICLMLLRGWWELPLEKEPGR